MSNLVRLANSMSNIEISQGGNLLSNLLCGSHSSVGVPKAWHLWCLGGGWTSDIGLRILDGDNDSIRRVDGSMRSSCPCAPRAGHAFGKNGWAARFKSTQNDDKHQSNVRQKGESRCSGNAVNQVGVF